MVDWSLKVKQGSTFSEMIDDIAGLPFNSKKLYAFHDAFVKLFRSSGFAPRDQDLTHVILKSRAGTADVYFKQYRAAVAKAINNSSGPSGPKALEAAGAIIASLAAELYPAEVSLTGDKKAVKRSSAVKKQIITAVSHYMNAFDDGFHMLAYNIAYHKANEDNISLRPKVYSKSPPVDEFKTRSWVEKKLKNWALDSSLSGGYIERFFSNCEQIAKNVLARLRNAGTIAGDSSSPLGYIAWPNERSRSGDSYKAFNPTPVEKNTRLEKSLLDKLHKHFDDVPYKLDKRAAAQLQQMLASGQYRDVLKPPSAGVVYRGMLITMKQFTDLIGKSEDDIEQKGSLAQQMKWKPRGGRSSSWTTSKGTAWGFTTEEKLDILDPKKQVVQLVLHANVSDNKNKLLSGRDGLYKVRLFAIYDEEEEVVGLGDINVSKIEWKIKKK